MPATNAPILHRAMDGRPEKRLIVSRWPCHHAPAGVSAQGGFPMLRTVPAAALAPTALATSDMKTAEAAPSQQQQEQQKMKDCNDKRKEERARTGVKGGTAYRKFLAACLKKAPA